MIKNEIEAQSTIQVQQIVRHNECEESDTKSALNNLLIMYLPPTTTIQKLEIIANDVFNDIAIQWQNYENMQKAGVKSNKA